MNPRLVLLAALGFAAAGAFAAEATSAPSRRSRSVAAVEAAPRADSAVAPAGTIDSFRIISDRNIFNPNRTGRRERTEERAPRVDSISLVGTMESDKGVRAFFDGSDRAFRKALRVGDSVDKYKVTKITPHVVELEREGQPLSMRVGQQLRRPEGADWSLVGEDVVRREAEARAAAEAAGRINPSAPVPIPAGASDTLRKLMEARNKQLKQ